MDARVDSHDFGVSDQRLKQLSAHIGADVQRGSIPGAVILVARNNKIVYTDAIGMQDPKSSVPMKLDTIFRIASMTKPIVSVAAMVLFEECKILLTDPASKYLPELKDLKVGVEKKDAAGKSVLEEVSAVREITIQDLLRQTSGMVCGWLGTSLVKQQYLDAKVEIDPNQTLVEHVGRLAKLPLAYQPGTSWEYSDAATNVLGAIIEQVSGRTLDVFLFERILKPLGMKDTGFWVDTGEHARIAEPLAVDPDLKAPAQLRDIRSSPRFLRAASGMVSTASDYYQFLQMLLNGGTLEGAQILSRKSVELMTSDNLGAGIARGGPLYLPGPGYGFGFGLSVRTAPGEAPSLGSIGDYQWSGASGTFFFVDPKEKLIGIYLMQRPNFAANFSFWRQFRTGVYAAID